MTKIINQLLNRNKREKQNIPSTKRMIFDRVKYVLYKTNSAPILLGLRRVGKTTIFRQILFEDKKAIFIPFDDLAIRSITDIELAELFDYFYNQGYRTFLIDEAQELRDWDKKFFGLINSYRDCRFAITGSSSLNLSKRETGLDRTTVINISTLTFDEYLNLKNIKRSSLKKENEIKETFENFLGTGGFPYYVNEQDFLEGVYKLKENILKDLIDNDIPRTFQGIKPHILNILIKRIANLTNGELNKSRIIKGIDRFTQRELDQYIDIMEKARIIKTIERINVNGQLMSRPKIKVYLNPHIHIWLLEKKFSDLNSKAKGHIIESYWLTWVDSINRLIKKLYYIKDKNNNEIDFVSMNADGSFKTVHEFKYSKHVLTNPSFKNIKSNKKIIWCLEDKEEDGIKYISILKINNKKPIQ